MTQREPTTEHDIYFSRVAQKDFLRCDSPFLMNERRFKSNFGCTATQALDVWPNIEDSMLEAGFALVKPKHLLWGLCLLKTYSSEDTLASISGASEKTFRKYAKAIIEHIAALYSKVVSLQQSFLIQFNNITNHYQFSTTRLSGRID